MGVGGGVVGGGDKNMLVKQASITTIREGVMEFFFYGLSIANRNSAASHKTRKVPYYSIFNFFKINNERSSVENPNYF